MGKAGRFFLTQLSLCSPDEHRTMDLLGIRTQFVNLSGRWDLVTDVPAQYTDNGANFFIQAGQRMLDRLPYEAKHQSAEWATTLLAGEYMIKSSSLRAVEAVHMELTEGMVYLERFDLRTLREYYGDDMNFAAIDPSTPKHYTPVMFRDVDTPTATTELQKGIFILPPTDVDRSVTIQGLFDSAPLLVDTDVSFWSIAFPETLVQAAWYELERFYRNKQGMEDHMESIMRDLEGIDHDEAWESTTVRTTMRNSW